MNNVTLIGRLVRDPELRATNGGAASWSPSADRSAEPIAHPPALGRIAGVLAQESVARAVVDPVPRTLAQRRQRIADPGTVS